MINILNMNFPDDNYPDFGSIALDREGDLMLLRAVEISVPLNEISETLGGVEDGE